MTATPAGPSVNFAEQLVGLTLNGWRVDALVDHRQLDPKATGGNFSQAYMVSRDGGKAFLKAFDLASVLRHQSKRPRAEVLAEMAVDYAFEQKVLARCAEMERVVRVLGSGDVEVEQGNAYSWVPYIIFELASRDVRKHLDARPTIGIGWLLRAFHHIAVALAQLHREGVAHQDLKPSNALVFDPGSLKLADVGRASLRGDPHRFDAWDWVGETRYQAPELLYVRFPLRRFGNLRTSRTRARVGEGTHGARESRWPGTRFG
jgi:serine/threonine protein kinase